MRGSTLLPCCLVQSSNSQRACFSDLDAPVERVGGAEVPMPYARPLERAALVNDEKIYQAAKAVLRESGR